ncbi:MAG TPA: MBL fold metallo-hydrolase [Jatrophihabitans sp.]|jgi:glyoxylase-like metal-dependent hydrolase (beta-lactamase superfamily II)/rhodanese-related sulfurtransferase
MEIEIVRTDELGDRSYVVHDGACAVVVDPQRDLDRVEQLLDRLGVTVTLVVETHIHNDYVTGGCELARRAGARYAVNAVDEVAFDRLAVRDGDVLEAGTMRVAVHATPGHTDTHLAYVVTDTTGPDEPPAVFTGGSLLYGSVGRTDLVDPDRTVELTRAQYRSAHKLSRLLPDDTAVFPTHGFGSFCSSGSAAGGEDSTIGIERSRNDALTEQDEQTFVDNLVANLTAYPSYYVHMAPLNRQGPGAADLGTPEPVDSDELAKRIAAGEWVVDLRDRVAYAADHVGGSVSIELGTQFATYVGWLAPWGGPLTLIGATPEQIADARRQLVRIGVDHLAGAASGELDELAGDQPRRSFLRVDFAETRVQRPDDESILDVRRDDERVRGGIAGSAHVPITALLTRLDELPDGRLWVHCHSGFRAGIAASLLERAGREVVHIDDDYENAPAAGFEVDAPAHR